ncbi:aldo/keto reductase [Evansella clarkii]|uniref:aldo/keto reductase n=1 Tax=Evansella clarkii TaxID=79879 RepID=UPI000B43CFE0|nr:aldo/keto reductase [Evansella clarkii]
MRYKQLGSTGVEVSALCLGTMAFGRWIDEDASVSILETALSQGINFIDTANYYGKGQDEEFPYGTGASEEIIGKFLKGKRDQVILATKVGLPTGRGRNQSGLSRTHIMKEVDASLRRLQTDYIDLYQVHHFDPNTPLEETLSTLNDLIRQGKVRYIGCSNFAAWQIAKSHTVSEKINGDKFISVQPPYNLLQRDIEKEILPFAESEGTGVIVYSPMARGLLSGKYTGLHDAPPPESRAAHGEAKIRELFTARNFELVGQLKVIAEKYNVSLSQFALSWVLNEKTVTSAIIGASKDYHVTAAVEISDWQWPEELREEVDEVLRSF